MNTADDTFVAIMLLLQTKFTALQNNSLWISGEGYAGIYVPWVLRNLDAYINETKSVSPDAWVPNLNGSLVGNGFTNFKYDGIPAYVTMAFYHGLIDDELYDYITGSCNITYINVLGTASQTLGCLFAMEKFNYYTGFANSFDVYGKCYKTSFSQKGVPKLHETLHAGR